MRGLLGLVAMTAILAVGARMVSAQMVDPTTGMMVDPTTDPTDYVSLMTGQPTNPGLEAIAQMNAQQLAQAQAQQQQNFQSFMNSSSSDDNSAVPAPRSVATTPKPTITPKGGTFAGSVEVVINDADAQAMVHYTTDGSKPTAASPLYVQPFTITAKTKVKAVAIDGSERPSSVVTSTFKIKS